MYFLQPDPEVAAEHVVDPIQLQKQKKTGIETISREHNIILLTSILCILATKSPFPAWLRLSSCKGHATPLKNKTNVDTDPMMEIYFLSPTLA